MSDQKVLLSVCNKFVTEHFIILTVKKAAFKTLESEKLFLTNYSLSLWPDRYQVLKVTDMRSSIL